MVSWSGLLLSTDLEPVSDDELSNLIAYGDTHLICTCDSVEEYADSAEGDMTISGGIQSNT